MPVKKFTSRFKIAYNPNDLTPVPNVLKINLNAETEITKQESLPESIKHQKKGFEAKIIRL